MNIHASRHQQHAYRWRTVLNRAAIIAVFWCMTFALCACASTSRTSTFTGIAVDLFVEHDDSAAVYRATPNGTIEFAGGMSARNRTIDWTGTLTSEEIEAICTLLQANFWHENRRDAGRPSKGEQRFEINVRTPELRNRIIIRADPQDAATFPQEVASMHELLRTAAARRFDPVLRDLPKAGPLTR